MDKLAILKFNGDFQTGFQVNLEIWREGKQSLSDKELELTASLPPNPELAALAQQHWQDKYRSLGAPSRWIARVQPLGIVYDGSIDCVRECRDSARDLSDRLNAWLDEREFRPIERKLSDLVPLGTGLRVLVRTEDELLPKLPWHLWECIAQREAEVAFSPHDFHKPKLLPTPASATVRILAILGHSLGINVEADRQLLQNLPGADVTFLVEPSRTAINDLLWDGTWDILFFAGHSETEGETGRIYINSTDSFTLDELGYGLQRAADRGLKIAIFNSCDGLGLARQLNALNIPLPQIVVMRELVPDLVAQKFLKYFLTEFSRGQSFYRSVKQARERLQGLEDEFPCASWLPTIVQHPAVFPLKWDDFLPQPPETAPVPSPPHQLPLWQRWLCWSLVIACLVITGRSFGLMQAWELKTLDALMRLRPEEPPDPRIAIVTVTEADIQAQDITERRGSLSDTALTQALQKLKQYQPRVIALDIYRPFAVQPNQKWLAEQLKSPTSPIVVCSVEGGLEKPGIPPPPNVPPSRVGFSDILIDPDAIVRRQLFGMSPGKICNTDKSFSFQVAQTYLSAEGIEFERTSPQSYRIGTTNFPRIASNTGGYHNLDAGGYQVLLNYRSLSKAPAQTLSLGDLLSDRFDPEWIRDQIVLIGTTAHSIEDGLLTPYSAKYSPIENISGVFIQAQMVSQILSAVKDNRPLLRALPEWGEVACIGLGVIVGEMLFFGVFYRRKIPVFLYLGSGCIVLLGLVGIGFVLLLEGIWLPIVPIGCAFALSNMRHIEDVLVRRDSEQ
jgi:CHASE2 domain-containing sensor protein